MKRWWLLLGVTATTWLPGCSLFKDCERAACDAVLMRIPDDGSTGIAGHVAAPSDVVENGCQNCPFGQATLDIRRASLPVTDALSARVAVANVPPTTVSADAHYNQPLAAGNYVLCQGTSCVAIEVVQDHLTTVHVLRGNGPATFRVFDGRTGGWISPPTFDLDLSST